jgi:AhpD family alkylhydroperoxidase
VGTVLLELSGQELPVVHLSHLPGVGGHPVDPPTTAGVTGKETSSMETMIPEARLTHPVYLLDGAMEPLQALGKVAQRAVGARTAELVALRASQINGCGVCAVQHPKILRKLGETDDRIFAVTAWREAPFFTEAERAALALTEAMCRIADTADPVPDEIWEEAARHYDDKALAGLLLAITNINVWNRLNVATRQVAGKEW